MSGLAEPKPIWRYDGNDVGCLANADEFEKQFQLREIKVDSEKEALRFLNQHGVHLSALPIVSEDRIRKIESFDVRKQHMLRKYRK